MAGLEGVVSRGDSSTSPQQLATSTENGKEAERLSRWSEDQPPYEFSEEDFTLYPQV